MELKFQPVESVPKIHGRRFLLLKDCGPGSLTSYSVGYRLDYSNEWYSADGSGGRSLESMGYRITNIAELPESTNSSVN